MRPLPFGVLAILILSSIATASPFRIINGKEVPAGVHGEIVRISSNGAGCTATVVGPRVIITAAHCAKTDATATFKVNGTEYSARIVRSPVYPGKDHDIAIGITPNDINVKPASVMINDTAKVNMEITLYGYGCTQEGGGGGNDGILRYGQSLITSFSGYDMVSKKSGGAALCFGDSGGPAFITQGSKEYLIGINSKGNIKDTNYNARVDSADSMTFLKNTASSEGITICGVNSDCSEGPAPTAPTCTVTASPQTVKVGNIVTLKLATSGQATSATLDGQSISIPSGQITVTPTAPGTYTAKGSVTGPGGTGNCQAQYVAENDGPAPTKPECTLTADPEWIKLGEKITLSMSTKGNVTQAIINGQEVGFPSGNLTIEPTEPGNYTASGVVIGPAGTNTCWVNYKVDGDLPPQLPNFTVVPTHCGDNTLGTQMSQVKQVCLANVKKDISQKDSVISQAILITMRNGDVEVMPIINQVKKKDDPKKMDIYTYANGIVNSGAHKVLDTRQATLVNTLAGTTPQPASIQGRAACGQYYIVDKLDSSAVPVPISVAAAQ